MTFTQRSLRIGGALGAAVVLATLCIFTARGTAAKVPTSLESSRADTITSTVFLPMVASRYDPSLVTPPFGVQMYGRLNANTGITYAVDVGASWVRAPVSWKLIEPTDVRPDQYNWADPDNIITDPAQRGLNLLVTINSAPEWAATYTNGPIDKVDLGEFTEFVGSLVERYDGDGFDDAPGSPVVSNWEFYNEPDCGDEFRASLPSGVYAYWGPFGDEYAAMLKAVYPVVKEANPNARVVFGGMSYDWFEDQDGIFVREFLDDVLAAGGGDYFDVMNIHAYPAFSTNWASQGPGLLQKTEFVRAKMLSYGIDKPIMITEAGWFSNDGPPHYSSPESQARHVVELYTQGMAGDAQVLIWFMLKEPGGFYGDWGLLDYELSPKPSYVAYQTISDELGAARFERILSPAETGTGDMEAYKFSDKLHQKDIYVAWLDPMDTSSVQPLLLSSSTATVRDIYGNAHDVADGHDGMLDGMVTIEVGGQPVYVEIAW
jgi:hypothetical protein